MADKTSQKDYNGLMENRKVARIFQEIGDVLELMGENRFRYLSYHRAAQIIDNLNQDVRVIYDQDPKQFLEIPGIGKDLSAKIIEILETGQCQFHQQLLSRFKKGLLELLTLRTMGPKKVKRFYELLGIDTIQKLKKAAETGELAKLPGMGEKSQAEILKAIEDHALHRERTLLHHGTLLAEALVNAMKRCSEVDRVAYAGSVRRGKETIGDVDILTTGKNHPAIIDYFVELPDVVKILAKGDTKASVLLSEGIQVDLRVVDENNFGAALYYFTGSKEHNIRARKIAISKGLKVNEYGIFKGEKQIAGKTEEEMFKTLGLPTIIPELREDNGEIEAGFEHHLPDSIELKDIRGDLHAHTKATDGADSLETMVQMGQSLGYEYMAITDHSPSVRVANGLNEKRLIEHLAQIDALNKTLKHFRILKGAEIDILDDGSLDYPDEILKKLDLVNISVHSKFSLDSKTQTARVIKAISNPYVTVLCHPTGRIVKQREPFLIDIVEVARAAKKYGVALEINGSSRLDLSPGNAKLAKEQGAQFVISTDAHQASHMNFMRFGIMLARRGWIERKDVLNILPAKHLLKYFHQKRPSR